MKKTFLNDDFEYYLEHKNNSKCLYVSLIDVIKCGGNKTLNENKINALIRAFDICNHKPKSTLKDCNIHTLFYINEMNDIITEINKWL